MKRVIFILVLIFSFIIACRPSLEKQLTNKKWYLYGVGMSFFEAESTSNITTNYQYYKKARGAQVYWTFTPAGNYTIVENGTVADGKWEYDGKNLKLNSKNYRISKINNKELQLTYNPPDKANNVVEYILIFNTDLENWISDKEIDEINSKNELLF